MKDDREYRSMELRILPSEVPEEKSYKVEGYAATFNPYVLLEKNGIEYKEQILPTAFDEADLTDVVFRVDHTGPVYARTSAGTVDLNIDEHGLHVIADLSRTARSRAMFEEIEAGNYPQMSFCFSLNKGEDDKYDKRDHVRIIHRFRKVFDISPVSFPANPGTELSVATRDYFDGVIEMEQAERLERERRERQKQKIRIMTEVNYGTERTDH